MKNFLDKIISVTPIECNLQEWKDMINKIHTNKNFIWEKIKYIKNGNKIGEFNFKDEYNKIFNDTSSEEKS